MPTTTDLVNRGSVQDVKATADTLPVEYADDAEQPLPSVKFEFESRRD